MKENCWEYMKCGREPGGSKAEPFGVCPATTETRTDGVNNGKNGGRACWGIPNTKCNEIIYASNVEKYRDCLSCRFFNRVFSEEYYNDNYATTTDILNILKGKKKSKDYDKCY